MCLKNKKVTGITLHCAKNFPAGGGSTGSALSSTQRQQFNNLPVSYSHIHLYLDLQQTSSLYP